MKIRIPHLTYSLSRPVPWSWYTPVVTTVGLLLVAALSVLNYAVNGFDLVVEYQSDPNITTAKSWAQNGILSAFSKVKGSCQPVNLEVGATFYTNKLALPYTISGFWSQDGSGQTQVIPSLIYTNNNLSKCNVSHILVDLESTSRSNSLLAYSWFGVEISVSYSRLFWK